jgi:hypothetical protein
VNKISNTNLLLYVQLYFPVNGVINITFDRCLQVSFSNENNYLVRISKNTILISNISNSTISSIITLSNFTIINPKGSKNITINVTTQYTVNSKIYFI